MYFVSLSTELSMIGAQLMARSAYENLINFFVCMSSVHVFMSSVYLYLCDRRLLCTLIVVAPSSWVALCVGCPPLLRN